MEKKMGRILVSAISLCMAMGLCACSGKDNSTNSGAAEKSKSSETSSGTDSVGDGEGKTLNIEVWNDEFQSRVSEFYPGYEKVDDKIGKIGDVTINWITTPTDGDAYQNNLDTILPGNADVAEDQKVDIFLVDADSAKKYTSKVADVAMTLDDLGIKKSDLSEQYDFTQEIIKDEDGKMRGSAWQACAAGFIYNKNAAREVLGADDPGTVQEAVKDWDSYRNTAEKMKDAGYLMTPSAFDTYRVYADNVSKPWVSDSKVQIDDNIKAWADASKNEVDEGITKNTDIWSDDWNAGMYSDGKVFGYFGPEWFINYRMKSDDASSIAAQGGWGYCTGPGYFYWDGSWICAANGTDNPTLVKDIILKMTTDNDIMKEMATKDFDCVNNKSVLSDLAGSEDGNLSVLGGQNPYKTFAECAENINIKYITEYDLVCNEYFKAVMKGYFDGTVSYDDALAQFKKAVTTKYPELTTD